MDTTEHIRRILSKLFDIFDYSFQRVAILLGFCLLAKLVQMKQERCRNSIKVFWYTLEAVFRRCSIKYKCGNNILKQSNILI